MYISNEITIRVRYGETDQMGVVHHANYAKYLEMARIEWLRELGTSYKDMEADGVLLPVVSLTINFKNSALFDDLITVWTQLSKKPSVKIEFDYKITNQNGDLLSTAHTVLAFVNKETGRPMRCPEFILAQIGG